jgi:hypothetical protein
MNKIAALRQLHEIATYHLFGPGGWPMKGKSLDAFHKTTRRLDLDKEVPGGQSNTPLGSELNVDLMTVFAGAWDLYDLPHVLFNQGCIDWSETDELWEQLSEPVFERMVYYMVCRAYRNFCRRSNWGNPKAAFRAG